ncbi:hypothetical protein HAX54_042786 [Datura stramonium]|uniref:AP2/ERF domain-containing protein n=1 Tax=Datura stramonium TaxID=4076 RepID=A0ABS8SMR7_DATST|nr:hypothetical protein [Datura stramonium]
MEGGPSQPKYKGVRLRKWGKWVSEVRLPNSRERIWLGSYDSAEKAARAFDAAQFCLRGPNAKFNFPDSPPNIYGGQRLSPGEIQAVAARFANDYTSQSEESVVQEIRPLPSHGHDHGGNMGNMNSHVINMEKEETSLSPANCDVAVAQMDTTTTNNSNSAAMDWAFWDMLEHYPHHASGPSPDLFCDPHHASGPPPDLFCDPHNSHAAAGTSFDYGYYPGVLDSLSIFNTH